MKSKILTQSFAITALSAAMALLPNLAQAGIQYEQATNAHFQTAEDFLSAQKRIHRLTSITDEMATDAKLKALSDYAKQVAMQASIRSNMKSMSEVIRDNSRRLDAIYDFQPLMIHGRVVPPVVTEAHDLYNQSGAMQIRLTDRVYDIISQARFASTAPNWRDYLNFPQVHEAYDDYIYLTAGLKPENKLEREVWEKATKEGWKIGQVHANQILLESMDRLNRDYIGMIRFHRLVEEGKLDMPAITSYDIYDGSDGVTMLLGEKLLQITSLPQFKNPTPDIRKQHDGKVSKGGHLISGEVVETDVALHETETKAVQEIVTKAVNDQAVIEPPPYLYTEPKPTSIAINGNYVRGTITRTAINDAVEVGQTQAVNESSK